MKDNRGTIIETTRSFTQSLWSLSTTSLSRTRLQGISEGRGERRGARIDDDGLRQQQPGQKSGWCSIWAGLSDSDVGHDCR